MMQNEDGDIFEVADPRGEFEQKVISEMQIAAFAEQSISENSVSFVFFSDIYFSDRKTGKY